jgi:hypothetical protein
VATKKSRYELLYQKPWVRLKRFGYARTIGGKPRECNLCGKTVIYALHGCVPKGMQELLRKIRKRRKKKC